MAFEGSWLVSLLCLCFNITASELHEQEELYLIVEFQTAFYLSTIFLPLTALTISLVAAFYEGSWCRFDSIRLRFAVFIISFFVCSFIFAYVLLVTTCPHCTGLEDYIKEHRTLDTQNQVIVK